SQTKSSTQRPLMYPDEIMRMDNQECLVLLRGQKPMRLYKIIPDEHPSFGRLRDVRMSDYVWSTGPSYRRRARPSGASPQFPADNANTTSSRSDAATI
ncbi:MAG: type IV secretory system conjugative DNA transfer family protein, partial [Oscillospiraceae bacterium]|nr:type IV secretory system conjugative DNA transfer family protein [Oscillospiraceae bacterium]